MARELGRDDLMLVLISGGASALLPAPVAKVPLAEKAALTSALMRAGASIHELNTVRKHLSRLKGGGLARTAAPARVVLHVEDRHVGLVQHALVAVVDVLQLDARAVRPRGPREDRDPDAKDRQGGSEV